MFSPQVEWLPPTEFPDLSKYDEISIDLETKDPDLKIMGSGSVTSKGHIVGIAVAVHDWAGYYPIRHEGGGNMDHGMVTRWFQDVLNTPAIKIFHNAMYDVCFLRAERFKIEGKIVDTMIAGSLVDENRFRYDLGSLGRDYVGVGKNEAVLAETAKQWGIDPKSEMYKLPAMYVGEYAEQDAVLTLKLWQEMKKEIMSQDLEDIFNLETELFPCLVDMRFLGVRVDTEGAHELKKKLLAEEKACLQIVKKQTGVDTQIWAARSIAQVFQKLNLPFDRTEKTNSPSFTKNFLQNHPHPMVQKIARAREINKAHTTFIDTIIKHEHKGRIYAEINQLRSDNGGTVTGRFSYSNPNLQQIPARNKELGPMIRSLFIPEHNCKWGVFDYSQQEPRLVVHYAALQNMYSVGDVLDAYNEGDADFHKIVADMADIPREQAKTINLGLFYGMGKNKLQAELGVNKEKADELFRQYHSRVPFVKQLMDSVMARAQDRGKVRTLLGRLCRFHLWEPNQFGIHKALSHEAALAEHGPGIKRAYTYKALNKLIQGSAADMTKKAMIDLYKEGITPHIQVHDELDISVDSPEHAQKIKDIMESAVNLEVPNKVDYESGPNWGQIK
jgi:DNA polymerase I-like protein with 3'-5' exonuclease and polymerase domains|tara:strand:- start:641 stop:2479 length:1839 start_codon:yes stop_codon:yes gene_type:complete